MQTSSVFHKEIRAIIFIFALLTQVSWATAQVIPNGRFRPAPNCTATMTGTMFNDGCITGWYNSHGLPNSGGSGLTGNGTPAILVAKAGGYGEGIYTQLSVTPRQTYQLTFWTAPNNYGPSNPVASNLTVALAGGLVPPASATTGATPNPQYYTAILQTTLPTRSGWTQQSIQFTAPSWSHPQLWFYTDFPSNGVNGSTYQVGLDSLIITPVCSTTNDIYYQNTSALPADTRTQGSIIAGNQVLGYPSGAVVVTSSQTVAFRALAEIRLEEGFSAEGGSGSFEALVVGCRGVNSPYDTGFYPAPPPLTGCDCLATSTNFAARPSTALNSVGESLSAVNPALFPNPTTGNLEFHLSDKPVAESGAFTIYSVAGEKVRVIDVQSSSWQSGSLLLDVSTLENGLYYYRFISDSRAVGGRFVVQK